MLSQGTPQSAITGTVAAYGEQVDDLGGPWSLDKLVLARGMYCVTSTAAAADLYPCPHQDFLPLTAKVSAPPPARWAPPIATRSSSTATRCCSRAWCAAIPTRCALAVQRLAEMGIEHVIFFVNLGDMEHEPVVPPLKLFAAEVMPRFPS